MLSNKCTFIGRFTADPELRTTKSGVSVTRFTLAVPSSYSPKGQERGPDFIYFCAWRHKAESICKFMRKGSSIAISGSLHTGKYTDKDGVTRQSFEVTVDDFNFVGGKVSAGDEIVVNPSVDGPSPIEETEVEIDFAQSSENLKPVEGVSPDHSPQQSDSFNYPENSAGYPLDHNGYGVGHAKPAQRHIYLRTVKQPAPVKFRSHKEKFSESGDYSDLNGDWEELSSSEDLPF